MVKGYIALDVHKEKIVIGVAKRDGDPILHGKCSTDIRVFMAALRKLLKKYNKDFQYLELDGADHFSSTLFYRHQIALYETMMAYLENDCGPEGL